MYGSCTYCAIVRQLCILCHSTEAVRIVPCTSCCTCGVVCTSVSSGAWLGTAHVFCKSSSDGLTVSLSGFHTYLSLNPKSLTSLSARKTVRSVPLPCQQVLYVGPLGGPVVLYHYMTMASFVTKAACGRDFVVVADVLWTSLV